MIAIDTNVLLRYLLDDDAEQSPKAKQLISSDQKILITDIVLIETVWTLRGARYGFKQETLVRVINALFDQSNLFYENGQVVWRALQDYAQAPVIKVNGKKKQADFADALIVNKARYTAQTLKEPFDGCATFDRAAQAIEGTIEV